ncbi:MAG: hypothetical protein IT472_03190 [Thermomonas sp.]|nr:hypothetical protein [Thermomonas sp.]MBZ0088211.1 hypothetical protein [Thermomonas sp.]MCC7096168.1 hypothetical protein [Thermomonas sp.]
MPLARFHALSDAEARRQRRMQVNACIAARSAQYGNDDFKRLMRSLTDGD